MALFCCNVVKNVDIFAIIWYNICIMGRILALDVGDVRIGIAVSDTLHILAHPVETYTRTGNEQTDINHIVDVAKAQQAELIVAGLPLRLDGNETLQTQKATCFAQSVADSAGLKLIFRDERLTTVEAEEILLQSNMRRDKRKKVIDQVAATIILQSYLDSIGK